MAQPRPRARFDVGAALHVQVPFFPVGLLSGISETAGLPPAAVAAVDRRVALPTASTGAGAALVEAQVFIEV